MRSIRSACLLASGLVLSASVSAEVVIAAGANSPLASLSKSQVAEVFLGKAKSVGGKTTKPVDYAGAPKTEFWDSYLGKSSDQLKAHYAKLQFTGLGGPPKELGSLADAKKAANEDPAVILYLDKAQVDSSLKVISP